ncbi:MAG: CU044_2847 family protein [Chloroflexota bacterium]
MPTEGSRRLVELDIVPGQRVFVEVDPDIKLSVRELPTPPDVAAAGGDPQEIVKRFEELSQYIADRAEQMIGRFKGASVAAKPSSVSLEFAIGLEGEAGIPFLAKGTSSANITITAEWSATP